MKKDGFWPVLLFLHYVCCPVQRRILVTTATTPAVTIRPRPAYKTPFEAVPALELVVGAVGVRVVLLMAGVGGTLVGTMVVAAAGTVFVATTATVARPVVGLGAGVWVVVGTGVADAAAGTAAAAP